MRAVAGETAPSGRSSTRSTRDAVNAHADSIGRIDISFNAITHNDVQGTPMAEMAIEDYLAPVVTASAPASSPGRPRPVTGRA